VLSPGDAKATISGQFGAPIGSQSPVAILECPHLGSRVERLRRIKAPTLVIHGADDPLVPVAAGAHTAQTIPGAKLKIVPGMGHDLPRGLVSTLPGLILNHCRTVDETTRHVA
jgi:pimeloyl-ACP methyl ester carboxylesterase